MSYRFITSNKEITDSRPSLLALVLLISFGTVCAVLFTPALPMIADYFQISNNMAQWTVSLFLIGYAVGQLPYGPLANRFGRIITLKIGIILQIIGSLLCILSFYNGLFSCLLIGRFIMALGASVGLMISFTLMNDFYNQNEARNISSKLMTAFAIIPGIALSIGGMISDYFSWQGCFYFLLAYGFVILCLAQFGLSEPDIKTESHLSMTKILNNFSKIIQNKKVIHYALLMGGCSAILYIYNAISPFLAIEHLKLSESTFGMYSMIPPIGILLGSFLSQKLNQKYSARTVILLGMGISFAIAIMMLVSFSIELSLVALFGLMMFINMGLTLVLSNASVLSSSSADDKATASSMMNFINMSVASIGVGLTQSLSLAWMGLLPAIILVILSVMFVINPRS